MARLTARRLSAATDILERYRALLFGRRWFHTGDFQAELRLRWGLDGQELKGAVNDLAAHGRFQEVAAFFMEHGDTAGVAVEFQSVLAELYGVKRYHAPERGARRDEFWKRAFEGS